MSDKAPTAMKIMYRIQKDESSCSIGVTIMTKHDGGLWTTWDCREHEIAHLDELHAWLSSFMSGVRVANPDLPITEHVNFSL